MENNKISPGESGKVDFASFLPRNQQKKKKNRKCHTGSDQKATNFDFRLFNGIPKFPFKFVKEIISSILPYVELIT